MAPEPRTRLNVSVRIAAHAITALALGALGPRAMASEQPLQIDRARVRGPIPDLDALSRTHHLGIDHGSGPSGATVYGTPRELAALSAHGLQVETLPSPPPVSGYRMPIAGDALLASLAADSDRAGVAVLGHSVEGRPIWGLWLGQAPESGAPVHRVLGAHHGDEYSSFEVALETAVALADGDGSDPAITVLLDQVTIWVVPYCNPDGVVAGRRWNSHQVDLNRNYDFEWSATEFLPGPHPFSEPEVRGIRSWAHWVQPVLGLSLHSGATNFGWVWNYTTAPAADAYALKAHAERYAAHNTTPDFWVTNGAQWYRTWGDSNDWSYGRFGVWESTVELTFEKSPPAGQIPAFTAEHVPAVLDFIGILPDISGQVLDATTNRPVDAQVLLLDASGPLGQPFRTEPGTGWFHRLVDGAPIVIEVSAPGYASTTVPVETTAIRLEQASLDGRPLLPEAGTGRMQLPVALDGLIALSQPGHPSLNLPVVSGAVQVDPAQLAGGAWTVSRSDGVVHRHALLVQDATLTTASAAHWDATLTIDGTGFLPGVRVWALFGPDRARIPLPVIGLSSGEIAVDPSPLGEESGRVDLWILNAGEHLFLYDITDIGPDSWPITQGKPTLVGEACACTVKTGHLPAHAASWILTLLLLLFRRTQ